MRLKIGNLIIAGVVFSSYLFLFVPLQAQPKKYPAGEFNVGFSLLSDSDQTGYGFHAGIHAKANQWLGVEAQFDGWPAVTDSDMDYYNVTGGPRFSWRFKRVVPFAHFLVGGFFSRLPGITDSHFAMKAGGGVQLPLNKSFAWQLQVNDLILFSPEKHFLHLSTGIVYRWY